MRQWLVVAAALLLCGASHAADPVKSRAVYAENAKAKALTSKASNAALGNAIQTTCATEIAALKTTIVEAQKLAVNDIGEQKVKLSAAIEQRVSGLDALLAALKKFQIQLKDHVERVNVVYDKRYQQYTDDMKTSSMLLNDLGLMVAEPSKPSFKRITLANFDKYTAAGGSSMSTSTKELAGANMTDLPSADELAGSSAGSSAEAAFRAKMAARAAAATSSSSSEAAAATAAAAAAAAAGSGGTARFKGVRGSLLEITQRTGSSIELGKVGSFSELVKLSAEQGKSPGSCTAAWDATFAMYKTAHDNHYINDHIFEKERVALNKYLKLLADLINKKRSKREKLAVQLKQVQALVSMPEDDIGKRVSNALKEHEVLIKDACPKMASMNELAGKAKDAVIVHIQECSKADFGKIADTAGGAAAGASDAAAASGSVVGAPDHQLVSGSITHVPGEAGTAQEQAMDVVAQKGTVAIPTQQ